MISKREDYRFVSVPADIMVKGDIMPVRDNRNDGSWRELRGEDIAFLQEAVFERIYSTMQGDKCRWRPSASVYTSWSDIVSQIYNVPMSRRLSLRRIKEIVLGLSGLTWKFCSSHPGSHDSIGWTFNEIDDDIPEVTSTVVGDVVLPSDADMDTRKLKADDIRKMFYLVRRLKYPSVLCSPVSGGAEFNVTGYTVTVGSGGITGSRFEPCVFYHDIRKNADTEGGPYADGSNVYDLSGGSFKMVVPGTTGIALPGSGLEFRNPLNYIEFDSSAGAWGGIAGGTTVYAVFDCYSQIPSGATTKRVLVSVDRQYCSVEKRQDAYYVSVSAEGILSSSRKAFASLPSPYKFILTYESVSAGDSIVQSANLVYLGMVSTITGTIVENSWTWQPQLTSAS